VHIPYIEQEITGMGNVSLIDTELKFLVVKNGNKVDHPDVGPWQHNDMADCVSTVVADLLADQLSALEAGSLRIQYRRRRFHVRNQRRHRGTAEGAEPELLRTGRLWELLLG
jgi:hypothetical protein